jgi:hypothetical protein
MVPVDEEDADNWRDPAAVSAVAAVVPHYMSARSLALYARWWQLETWLRELAYVELRSLAGKGWTDKLSAASGRQAADAAHTHMAGADNENPLAYLDYSQIVEVMADHWDQFRLGLLERGSWEGRQDDLKRIRHRIGHLRRPHRDDLSRLEQTLRDLERGAFIALASYNRRDTPDPQHHDDPVTQGWIKGRHETGSSPSPSRGPPVRHALAAADESSALGEASCELRRSSRHPLARDLPDAGPHGGRA